LIHLLHRADQYAIIQTVGKRKQRNEGETKMTTNLRDQMQRIESACFDEINEFGECFAQVEFWTLPGSIIRTVYYPRTTEYREEFVPVDSYAFRRLSRMIGWSDFAI